MKFTYLVIMMMLLCSQIALYSSNQMQKMKHLSKNIEKNLLYKSVYKLKNDSNNTTDYFDNLKDLELTKNGTSSNTSSDNLVKNEYRLPDAETKRYSYSNADYSNMQKIIVEKDVQINNLNQEIYDLKKKIQILESKSSKYDSLTIKLDTLEVENKQLTSQLKIAKFNIEILEKKSSGKSEKKETVVNDQISNSNSESYKDKKNIEILENRIKHLEKTLEKYELKIKEKDEIIKKMQNKDEKGDCKEQEIKITQITTENITLKMEIKKIKIKITEITNKYNIILKEKEKWEALDQCETTKNELTKCNTKITNFEIEINNLNITIKKLDFALERCKEQIVIPCPPIEPTLPVDPRPLIPPVPVDPSPIIKDDIIDIPDPIPRKDLRLDFNKCLTGFLISITKDSTLCLKTDIINLRTIFLNKCPNDSSSNFIVSALKSLYLNVIEKTSNKINLDDENVYLRCFSLIKDHYTHKTNQELCSDEMSFRFFRNYKNKCEEKDKKQTQKMLHHDFITSMASVHKNTIANRDLYSKLNRDGKI